MFRYLPSISLLYIPQPEFLLLFPDGKSCLSPDQMPLLLPSVHRDVHHLQEPWPHPLSFLQDPELLPCCLMRFLLSVLPCYSSNFLFQKARLHVRERPPEQPAELYRQVMQRSSVLFQLHVSFSFRIFSRIRSHLPRHHSHYHHTLLSQAQLFPPW